MATRRVEIGPTGEAVRANIATIRRERGLTLRDLSDLMAEGGRLMAHNTLSEIERGARRVDVDDLMAIAVALDVPPNALLLPSDPDGAAPTTVTGSQQMPTTADVYYFLEGFKSLGEETIWSSRCDRCRHS
ncbi:helix-turn-helix domain-containing protein [Rhodococcus hoagii]|nr:helix-turn-helix domain-containing protein [Prescottella equi]